MVVVFIKTNIQSRMMNSTNMISYRCISYRELTTYFFLMLAFHFPLLFRETQSPAIISKYSYGVGPHALPGAKNMHAWCIAILTGVIFLFACYNKLFRGTGGDIIGQNQQVRCLIQSAATFLFTHKTDQVRLLNT